MTDDVTIPREMARDIAKALRNVAESWKPLGRSLAVDRLSEWADLLDPPQSSLRDELAVLWRDEIIGVSRDSWDEVADHGKARAYEFADEVLAVVRQRIGRQRVAQPQHGGDPGTWSLGYASCRDAVLALFGGTDE